MSFEAGNETGPATRNAIHLMAPRWKSLVLLGVLIVIMACVALSLLVASTIASVLMLGIFMAITGGAELVIAFSARSWSRFFIWIIAGVLYILAAAIAIAQPMFVASLFTLLLGAGLIATGVLRIVLGLGRTREDGRGLVLLAGAVTLLLGIVIVMGWPGNSPFLLGALLGVDLLFYGIGWIAFGLALRSASRSAG